MSYFSLHSGCKDILTGSSAVKNLVTLLKKTSYHIMDDTKSIHIRAVHEQVKHLECTQFDSKFGKQSKLIGHKGKVHNHFN